MAIELISTITTKNNGGYAIALSNEIQGGLHSKKTIEERNAITTQRLQEGMLCYVEEDKGYYQWKNEKWTEFTVNGNGDNILYRVDTYTDMLNINSLDLKNGYLCHVTNDENENFLYYYSNNEWKSFNTKHQVWIGTVAPTDKTCLWVDTSNMVINDDPSNITIDNYPTFIDTSLIQYMKEQMVNLNNKIKELEYKLKQAIKNGVGSNGDKVKIEIQGTYFVSEDGDYFITEDGHYIISEDSVIDEYTPDDEGTYIEGGGENSENTDEEDEEIILEDIAYSVKGGRYATSVEYQEILSVPLIQVTIFNESKNEINLIINEGETIPLEIGESLSFGDITIESIVVVEKDSIVKYIGI